MTLSQALAIMCRMRDNGHIDPDLFEVFVRERGCTFGMVNSFWRRGSGRGGCDRDGFLIPPGAQVANSPALGTNAFG